MDMRELELLVPTLFGLEGLCAEELRRLKLPEVAAENGRVRCKAAPADIPRVNLNLRTGERVLLVVGRYRAADFEALFEGCRALPWEEFIPREGAFPVKGHSLNSQLHAVPACQAVLKKAAAARLGEKYGLETLPESGALYQIQFSIMRDEVTLMLDTTGVGLHKRGYRAVGVAAPLRETLAAAMVLLSRYRGRDPFCDPFCGSGTIAIEAALIAKNRAPGLNRAFSAQKWCWLDSGLWLQAAGEAMDGEYDGAYDIEGQPPVALNEIHRRLGRVQQSPEVVKAAGIRAEHPQKIVARTHGVVGHSGVAEACGSGNSLVKGAVAAAGIDAHRLPPLRRRPGQLGPVAGVLGDRRLPWLVPPGQGSAELLPHLLGAVVFSRVGVD